MSNSTFGEHAWRRSAQTPTQRMLKKYPSGVEPPMVQYGLLYGFLQATVKSHKPPGVVGLRILHCSTRHPYKPLLNWIGDTLKRLLRSCPHIIRDTADLLNKLAPLTLDHDVQLRCAWIGYWRWGVHAEMNACWGRWLDVDGGRWAEWGD